LISPESNFCFKISAESMCNEVSEYYAQRSYICTSKLQLFCLSKLKVNNATDIVIFSVPFGKWLMLLKWFLWVWRFGLQYDSNRTATQTSDKVFKRHMLIMHWRQL